MLSNKFKSFDDAPLKVSARLGMLVWGSWFERVTVSPALLALLIIQLSFSNCGRAWKTKRTRKMLLIVGKKVLFQDKICFSSTILKKSLFYEIFYRLIYGVHLGIKWRRMMIQIVICNRMGLQRPIVYLQGLYCIVERMLAIAGINDCLISIIFRAVQIGIMVEWRGWCRIRKEWLECWRRIVFVYIVFMLEKEEEINRFRIVNCLNCLELCWFDLVYLQCRVWCVRALV